MKKTLAFIAVASLVTNTTIGSISAVDAAVKQKTMHNQTISPEQANKYALETSIVPKSLLIGKNQGFRTDSLLSSLNSKLDKSDLNFNLPTQNDGNEFINALTTNELDVPTIRNIQANFQSEGNNQKPIDDANGLISKYSTDKGYASDAVSYINNKKLSDPANATFLDTFLRQVKTKYPAVTQYLAYTKYEKFITLATNEILNDWDQQAQYDADPITAMQKYIHSAKGDITEGKTGGGKSEWNYVLVQAKAHNWTWNNFYEYMAGANLNYMFKTLSPDGYFIGNLIDAHLHLKPWNYGLDKDFMPAFQNTIDKLSTTPKAWPYLIKAVIPVVKTRILKMEEPTLGVKDLTWDNSLSSGVNKSVEVKLILQELAHLLSPEGKQDLIDIVANLLTGPFGSDIIFSLGALGYYTLPEAIEKWSWIATALSPQTLAGTIVDAVTKDLTPMKIPEMINRVIKFVDQYLTKNPQIDIRDLSNYLNKIMNSDFNKALEELTDIIENPTSHYKGSDILDLLGVQSPDQTEFKTDSPLYWLEKWLGDDKSSIRQLLGIFTSSDNTGIIDNMIKEQETFLDKNYYDYFDINNTNLFKVSNVLTTENDGKLTLSYTLTDVKNNKNYNLVFISANQDHKDFLLHRFN